MGLRWGCLALGVMWDGSSRSVARCSWLLGGEERGRGEGWGAVRNLTSQALPVCHLPRDGMMWTCHPALTHRLNPPPPPPGVQVWGLLRAGDADGGHPPHLRRGGGQAAYLQALGPGPHCDGLLRVSSHPCQARGTRHSCSRPRPASSEAQIQVHSWGGTVVGGRVPQ